MAQIVVRQLPDAVHAALHARARRLGLSAEALARTILAHELLPETRPRLGDQLAAIWAGADLEGVSLERDQTPHEPLRFE
jgi:plasmid stability protein